MSPLVILIMLVVIFMMAEPGYAQQLNVTRYNAAGAPEIVVNEKYSLVQKVGEDYFFVLREEAPGPVCQPPIICKDLTPGRKYFNSTKGTQYAFKFTYKSGLHLFWYDATAGYTLSSKRVAISEQPGNYSESLPAYCRRESWTGTIYYGDRLCVLTPNKTYYVNMLDVDCPQRRNCRFVMENR